MFTNKLYWPFACIHFRTSINRFTFISHIHPLMHLLWVLVEHTDYVSLVQIIMQRTGMTILECTSPLLLYPGTACLTRLWISAVHHMISENLIDKSLNVSTHSSSWLYWHVCFILDACLLFNVCFILDAGLLLDVCFILVLCFILFILYAGFMLYISCMLYNNWRFIFVLYVLYWF